MNKEERIRKSETFGSNIQKLRKDNTKYSQEQVGELLGLSRSQYSQIECGKYSVTVTQLAMLKKLFHAEYADFFKGIEPDHEEAPDADR